MKTDVWQKRVRSLQEKVEDNIFLVSNSSNITYLTGVTNIESRYREAWVLVTPKSLHVLASSLCLERFNNKPHFKPVVLKRGLVSSTIDKQLKSGSKVYYEDRDLRVAELRSIKSKVRAKFAPAQGWIEKMREIKYDCEIKNLERASNITAKTWREIKDWLKPGISEKEVKHKIIKLLDRNGSNGIPSDFDPIVAVGENSSIPHHVAGDRKIKKNEVVLVDFGCTVEGYCSDMTRTMFIGNPTSEFVKVRKVVKGAYSKATGMLRDGILAQEIDKKVIESIERGGFVGMMPHSTGHGLGIDVHESPAISRKLKKKTKLAAGMAITIEPGIYLPGKFGYRHENTLLVVEGGYKLLTN